MRVLLLSDPNSVHTQKWAKSLSNKGIVISVFGLSDYDPTIYKDYPNIRIYSLSLEIRKMRTVKDTGKFSYLKALPMLKRLIQEFRPDIVHAHFATSYGLLGALTGFHPYIISVWGSDVFDFPKKSVLHKSLLKFNLAKADKILSTSHVMAKETNHYTNKMIEVTPFGIDINVFKPIQEQRYFNENEIVIGTVKTLEEKYGIQYLVRAFKLVKDKYPNKPIKLLIVGGGAQEKFLRDLVSQLNLTEMTHFTGRVDFSHVPMYHNMMDISVFASTLDSESFGVAVIEAGACEKPVVVTRVGGLPEVVEDGVTGIIVDPKEPVQIAEAIETLILNDELREAMGKNGRERVKRLYNWEENVKQMIEIYNQIKI